MSITPADTIVLEASERPGYAIVDVRGEVDVYTCSRLRTMLTELCDHGARTLIIDASAVEFIDSSGLGVLVGAYKRCRRTDGGLLVVSPASRVATMLRMTGLTTVFGVFETAEDAVAEMQRRAREAQ